MKRFFSIILSLALLISLCPLPLFANAWGMEGVCGDNVRFVYDTPSQTLTISGTGPMYDYSEENVPPWVGQQKSISKCIIESGVTRIGDWAFGGSYAPVNVAVPETVTQIGSRAFADAFIWVRFLGASPELAPDAFAGASATCFYIYGWDEAQRQNYGGEITWEKATLQVTDRNKMLYGINEPISPEDFSLTAVCGNQSFPYTPRAIRTDSYDNSVCGEKSVTVTVDDLTFTHNYIVTDGQDHLNRVKVELPTYWYYMAEPICPEVKVSVGSFLLKKDVHYTVTYENNIQAGENALVTVTGLGEWAALSETRTFRILKRDLSTAVLSAASEYYLQEFKTPEVIVYTAARDAPLETDHYILYENNLNQGTATYHVVGIGNCYGTATGTFEIHNHERTYSLNGAYNGQADGELNTEVYTDLQFVTPGPFVAEINSRVNNVTYRHYAYYELYQMVGEELVLLTTYEPNYGYSNLTAFHYDFSHVYEEYTQDGAAVYVLAYTWLDSQNRVFSGACTLAVLSKVLPATEMQIAQIPQSEDFRQAHFIAYGLDGDIGSPEWTVSDPEAAQIQAGVVTFKTPGTVTVTARSGELQASAELTIPLLDITRSQVVDYNPETGELLLSYENIPLIPGTDYTVSAPNADGTRIVTGAGLFSGTFTLQPDNATPWHSHSFDQNCYSPMCEGCGLHRAIVHNPPDEWSQDDTNHWRYCLDCGTILDFAPHTEETACSVCGWTALMSGDINGDGKLNNKDAILLMQYLAGWETAAPAVSADINNDGKLNNKDVILLMQYLAGWEVTIY